MVHAGARGQTAQQIKSGLYLTDMENDQMYSEIGNALRKVKVCHPQLLSKNWIVAY